MKKRITLTMKEINRLKVLSMLEEQLITRAEAAEKLNVSQRQVYRIQKSYREKGDQGLVHGNRGKPSQRRIGKEVRDKIQNLLNETYSDYNTLIFQEILSEQFGINMSYSTLQSIRKAGEHPTLEKRNPSCTTIYGL